MAEWLVGLGGAYLLFGMLFGIAFVLRGAGRIDPGAREAGWGFRLLILPGAAALWPILLRRWLRGAQAPPVERNAHRQAVRGGDR